MTSFSMKSVAGQPVIALDTAEQVGKVKHFVVSTDVSRIERLHIDGRKDKAVFANWSDLESFGADRVMLVAGAALTEAQEDRDIDVARGDTNLLGSRALDTAGFEHGTVSDATFDPATGEIVAITTTENGVIPASRVRSLGSYALVFDVAE